MNSAVSDKVSELVAIEVGNLSFIYEDGKLINTLIMESRYEDPRPLSFLRREAYEKYNGMVVTLSPSEKKEEICTILNLSVYSEPARICRRLAFQSELSRAVIEHNWGI